MAVSILIVIGFQTSPKVEIYQSGFNTPIATISSSLPESERKNRWSPIPWSLPRTAGPAIEICSLGGVNETRKIVARQTPHSLGKVQVDFPKRASSKANFDNYTSTFEGHAELVWQGQIINLKWRESSKRGQTDQLVVRYPDGGSDVLTGQQLAYPNAYRLQGLKGLFVTRMPQDVKLKGARILLLNGDAKEEPLTINGVEFSPEIEFVSHPDPKFLRVTRFNTVRNRFQSHTFKLSFKANQMEGELLEVARFDRLRLPADFLERQDTTHFLVSDWLYQNPTPSPSQIGLRRFETKGKFVPDVENRISKYDCSSRPGIQVALTFDDGPVESTTPQVLDILRQNGVLATFFVRGDNAQKNPQLMEQIRAAGHEIGNHSWDHSPSWYLQSDKQIGRSNEVIKQSGSEPRFFRPPYGAMGKSRSWLAGRIAERWNMETIFWSVDPQEYRSSVSDDQVIQSVVQNIHDGAVVLMHDINSKTVRTLPEIIRSLQRQKVEFLTLTELRNLSKGKTLSANRAVPIRLPSVSGLPSYVTLPYLSADTGSAETRIEIGKGDIKFRAKNEVSRIGDLWSVPVNSGGSVYLKTNHLGYSIWMLLLAVAATFITVLLVVRSGPLLGAFLVSVLGLALTRFVLALSADHVFPDDVHLWNSSGIKTGNFLVENTTLLALFIPLVLFGMILPTLLISFQDSIFNRFIGRYRLRRWFGFLLGLVVIFGCIFLVWLIGGGERIGPVQKSALYLPLIILGTCWIVGVGGVRSSQSRIPTERCWPIFATLFLFLACMHGMFAVFRQDLGAVLVLLPATWLFLCYASSQANWLWRATLWVLAVFAIWWGMRFIASFLSAIHFDDYPPDIIPDVKAIKLAIGALIVLATLLTLRAIASRRTRNIGLPIMGASLFVALLFQFIPISSIARQIIVPKSESQKESLYSQYLRFRSVDREFLNAEGTQRAMEISEEQKIVDVYGMGGWFGDGFGTLPFDRSRYNFLNDYVVGTFIRGQFGLLGVLALAGWQLALVFYSTRLTLPKGSRGSQLSARLAFWEAVGKLSCWVIGFISIYMIISNLGFPWAPLTGKNVFLLGLNSSSDVLETSILVFLIAASVICIQKERRMPVS